jgi:hypothetical protein
MFRCLVLYCRQTTESCTLTVGLFSYVTGDLPQMIDSFFSWMNKTVASIYQWLLQSCTVTNSTTSHTVSFTTTATKQTAVLLCRLSVVLINIKLYGGWKSLTTRRTGFRQFIACLFVSDALFRGKIQIPNYSSTDLSRPMFTICTARFNTKKFHVQPTQCIYVFCVCLRKNSDYFPIEH